MSGSNQIVACRLSRDGMYRPKGFRPLQHKGSWHASMVARLAKMLIMELRDLALRYRQCQAKKGFLQGGPPLPAVYSRPYRSLRRQPGKRPPGQTTALRRRRRSRNLDRRSGRRAGGGLYRTRPRWLREDARVWERREDWGFERGGKCQVLSKLHQILTKVSLYKGKLCVHCFPV